MASRILDLGNRIKLIDGYDFDMENRTGTYVLIDDEITLIETGASKSIPHIKNGLKELNIELTDIKHIIVTHIHLDHSGGLGLLLTDCPNATCYVHPKGARHLIDPSRLIMGARAVYGEEFDKLFDPILPVPEEKVVIKEDGDTLTISKDRTLTFYDTKGHCDHHFSIHDSLSNGIFTGDTIGVNYSNILKDLGIEFYLPSTSPNQFRPDDMMESFQRIRKLGVEAIYFGHFGVSRNIEEIYRQIDYWLPIFMEYGQKALDENRQYDWLGEQLFNLVEEFLVAKGVPKTHRVFKYIKLDAVVGAMGVIDYLQKKK